MVGTSTVEAMQWEQRYAMAWEHKMCCAVYVRTPWPGCCCSALARSASSAPPATMMLIPYYPIRQRCEAGVIPAQTR